MIKKRRLTRHNKKDIRKQMRMGYTLPFFFFIIFCPLACAIYNSSTEPDIDNQQAYYIIGAITLAGSFLMSYSMNHKYYTDLKQDLKLITPKIIQRKIGKVDFEAGTIEPAYRAKKFQSYSIIIDNKRHKIKKTLFDKIKDTDTIYFHYAPKSRLILEIEVPSEQNRTEMF